MSHIQCPICGKHAAISGFDPSGYSDNIDVIRYKGKGYGRGFETLIEGEIHDYPELVERLKARLIHVLAYLEEQEAT